MTGIKLLNECDRRDISIGLARDGQTILLGPSKKVDRSLADALIQNRDELRRLLAPPAPSVATNVDRRCWRCGSPPTPPSPAQQVASIRVIQLGQPPAFQWAESELARLETRMESEPGCFVSMVRIDSVELVRIDGSKFIHFRTDA